MRWQTCSARRASLCSTTGRCTTIPPITRPTTALWRPLRATWPNIPLCASSWTSTGTPLKTAKVTEYKVVSSIDGVGTAAQLTLVVGSDGSGLPHPNWMENLKLAVALQEDLLTSYPTLMRPILLRNSRYNQHATTGSLLVEVGAAGNSPEEAALAGRLFAQRMVEVLESRSK